jgi:hypothetical protein
MAKKPSLLERLKAKKQPKTLPLMAIVWYEDAEAWAKAKALATDPERFESSYEQWQAVVNDSLGKYAQFGMRFKKVPIQAEALAEWCRQENKRCDSSARAEYVSMLAQAQLNGAPS